MYKCMMTLYTVCVCDHTLNNCTITYASSLTHTHTRMHTHTHTHTRAHTHMHTHTYAHTHARTHAHTHACTHMHARTHTHTHAHAHTCTRTHTHTHTHTQASYSCDHATGSQSAIQCVYEDRVQHLPDQRSRRVGGHPLARAAPRHHGATLSKTDPELRTQQS